MVRRRGIGFNEAVSEALECRVVSDDRRSGDEGAFDVVIVGGGPAGLSAGLILGRCRRRVLICDDGRPRNAASHALHGFLTRDGVAPAELLRIGREQLRGYETVAIRDVEVVDAAREGKRFAITTRDGTTLFSRKLLLATGVIDRLPQVPGFEPLYGRSAFHCPYCDGWEVRDSPLAVYAPGRRGFGLALELKVWSRDVVLCTDGPSGLEPDEWGRLSRLTIPVREERVARFEGNDGRLERVIFEEGAPIERSALFFNVGERQASGLALKLGCEFTEKGAVATGKHERTNIPGLYVAGDASRSVQLAIVAAGEGVEAAFAINTALIEEDLAGLA
jgi:thioredoxin reductase